MEKAIVKEGFKLAQDELKDEEKQHIKGVVKATLELLRKKEESRKILDDEIKVLRRDIADLADGRIDRIKERQDLDPKAKEASVIIIKEKIIEKLVPTPMWHIPWIIEIKPQYVPYTVYYNYTGANPMTANTAALGYAQSDCTQCTFTTTNSSAHMYTSGTYILSDNSVKYL